MFGCRKKHLLNCGSWLGPFKWAGVIAGLLSLPVSAGAVGIVMDTNAYVSLLPTFQIAPQDTSLALDLGELWSPPVPPAPFASRNSKQEPRFSLLGPPHTVATDVDTLPLDLETYRAFRSEDRIIDTWNKRSEEHTSELQSH